MTSTSVFLEEELGNVETMADIQSAVKSVLRFPKYVVAYPKIVIEALSQLYMEYNKAFSILVETNREWATDYQYCMGQEWPINHFVQIDMAGLPQPLLHTITSMSVEEVRELLRRYIFEIENSLAMYQILMRTFSFNGEPTALDTLLRRSLAVMCQEQ